MRNESRKSGSGRGGEKPVAGRRHGACRLLLHILILSSDLTLAPPLVLWPRLERRAVLPDDVERLLVAPLAKEG